MYSNETYEEIKERILKDISTSLDKREGSFIHDMISPIAVELTRTYIELDNVLNIAFIKTSYDEYLDRKVNEFGIYRKEGEKAIGTINILGAEGTRIPKGTIALTQDNLRFILDEGIITNGEVTVKATAEEAGRKYNVLQNTIIKLDIDIFGVEEISNKEFVGGIDRETDSELKSRFFRVIQKPMTSGNANHYEQWALEVNGVGNATVKPLWNGPGTVKVMISDSNKQPVSNEVIEACEEYIESVRPIGATVTVTTPSLFNISIVVDVDLDNTKTLEEVTSIIRNNLVSYFKICDEVRYTKVGGIIAAAEGVLDYRNLKINNATSNITIPNENIINLSSLVVT